MKNIFVESHRGMCAFYPENTMISFDAALNIDADAFEFDVWLTKDKVPVIMHDCNPKRTCGVEGDIRQMTLEEVKKLNPYAPLNFGDKFKDVGLTIPTLEELLILCKTKKPSVRLGVEIKDYTEECVDATVKLLKQYGFFDDCWFYAFNGRIIRYLKEKHGGRTMGYPDFQMGEFDGYDAYDEIGISMNVVKSEVFEIFAKKGLPMHLFCADTKEDVELCIAKGASLITANNPLPLIELVKGITYPDRTFGEPKLNPAARLS